MVNCIEKDGFEFCSIMYPLTEKKAINIFTNQRETEEYVEYINQHNIEQAYVLQPDLNFFKTVSYAKVS